MSLVVDVTVRMSLIVLVSLGATVALARRSAALRHWVLTVGIACAAATPLLQFVLPSWQVGVTAFSTAAAVEQQAPGVATTTMVRAAPSGERHTAQPPAPSNARQRTPPMPALLVSIWLAGALMGVSTLVVGLLRLSRAASAARPVTAERLVSIASDVQEAMGLQRPVTLLQSSDPALLVTWGAMRPTLILPADAPRWPDDRARVVMRHELAHIARGDWLAQMLAETLRAVYGSTRCCGSRAGGCAMKASALATTRSSEPGWNPPITHRTCSNLPGMPAGTARVPRLPWPDRQASKGESAPC